jgi:hypothetical protein
MRCLQPFSRTRDDGFVHQVMAEKTGPHTRLLCFVGRAIIVSPLILAGPWLVTYSYNSVSN